MKLSCPKCQFEVELDPDYFWSSDNGKGDMMQHILWKHDVPEYISEFMEAYIKKHENSMPKM